MAANTTLDAEPREGTGKGNSRKLRAAGRIPAVIYGRGEQTRSLSVDAHDVERLLAQVHVENTIIQLDIQGESAPVKALVREIQTHAYRPEVLHIDFYQIHAGERVTVEIPIRLTGSAPGVRAGGIMQQTLVEVEIRCLPDQIPEVFELDVSGLEIGDSLHVRDIALPEGVEVQIDPDRTIGSVIPPTVAPAGEEAVVEEEAEAEPEVIGRGKEEEEEG